jgi:hypothetical protein
MDLKANPFAETDHRPERASDCAAAEQQATEKPSNVSMNRALEDEVDSLHRFLQLKNIKLN